MDSGFELVPILISTNIGAEPEARAGAKSDTLLERKGAGMSARYAVLASNAYRKRPKIPSDLTTGEAHMTDVTFVLSYQNEDIIAQIEKKHSVNTNEARCLFRDLKIFL